jgi:putative transposase
MYAFIADHRPEFSFRAMCHTLSIHFSGFYACLKAPLSLRTIENARQTALIWQPSEDGRKVYGYRKLHDDLRNQGEPCHHQRTTRRL